MPRRILAAAVAATALLAGCSPTATPAASPSLTSSAALPAPTIGLTYIPNVQFSPFYTAEADGNFAAAGVNPTLRHHGTAEGLFTAIAAGEEQFVLAGGDEVLQAREQGLDLVAVASYYRAYPVEVVVADDSGIATLADLKGRTIGLPGKYGESWFGLKVALRTAGLTEADVEVAEIGYTQQAALSTGKVDAIVGFRNNEAIQFALAGFATRSLAIAPAQVPLVSICLVTTGEYAAANPEAVRGVAAGMLAGIGTVVADPDRALAASGTYVPGLANAEDSARATLDATADLWAPGGRVDASLDADQWTEMADFMADQGLTATRVDPTQAFSNEYLS